ncbi:MAG: hypothetical protein PUD56_07515 [Prevotella sp.]|nr:hypothetical protein [Prevotella sp.]
MEKKTISVEEFSVELTPYYIYIKREEGRGKRVEGRPCKKVLIKDENAS